MSPLLYSGGSPAAGRGAEPAAGGATAQDPGDEAEAAECECCRQFLLHVVFVFETGVT
jgi:hypothetical protein